MCRKRTWPIEWRRWRQPSNASIGARERCYHKICANSPMWWNMFWYFVGRSIAEYELIVVLAVGTRSSLIMNHGGLEVYQSWHDKPIRACPLLDSSIQRGSRAKMVRSNRGRGSEPQSMFVVRESWFRQAVLCVGNTLFSM
jgi:hypothetical protein